MRKANSLVGFDPFAPKPPHFTNILSTEPAKNTPSQESAEEDAVADDEIGSGDAQNENAPISLGQATEAETAQQPPTKSNPSTRSDQAISSIGDQLCSVLLTQGTNRIALDDGDHGLELQKLVILINSVLEQARKSNEDLQVLAENLDREVSERTRRLSLIANAIGDGIWVWDLETGEVDYSEQWATQLGEKTDSLDSIEDWLDCLHPSDCYRVRASLRSLIEGSIETFEETYRFRRRDSTYRWATCRAKCMRDETGRARLVAGNQVDQHELRSIDPVTGLLSSSAFLENLGLLIDAGSRVQVAIIGISGLSQVREGLDTREIGELRLEVARRLGGTLDFNCLLARLPSDMFAAAIPLDSKGEAQGQAQAERLAKVFTQPFSVAGGQLWLELIIGCTQPTGPESKAADALRDAWTSYHFAYREAVALNLLTEEQRVEAQRRVEIERDVRDALELGWFKPYLQPIVDCETEELRGYEALVRMEHPELGLISPGIFLPVAEAIGLKADVSLKVLYTAIDLLSSWQLDTRLASLFISVNLDAAQITHESFVEDIEKRLEQGGVPPERLKIEIVESTMIGNFKLAARQIGRLRKLGIQIALDDFGTGYSSLEYLHQLEVDLIKVDKSFVDEIETTQRKQSMVKTICILSDSLGAEVCMEGVETAAQLEIARDFQIDLIQGFFFSRPLPVDEAVTFAKKMHPSGKQEKR